MPALPSRRSLLRAAAALLLAVLLVAGLLVRNQVDLDWSLEGIRSFVAGLGVWAPVCFVLMLTFRLFLLLPSKLLFIVGGLLFGGALGTVYGALGATSSALLTFVLVRFMGPESLRRAVPQGLARTLEGAGSRAGALLLAAACAYPWGAISLYHAAAALTPMRFPAFALAAGAGLTVRAGTFAMLGSSFVDASLTEILVISGAVALTGLPLLHPRVRAWAQAHLR